MLSKMSEYLKMAGLSDVQIERLVHLGYEQAPASKGHHLNFVGGLVHHSLNVTDNILRLSKEFGYRWPREESPYLVGMLHDLVKARCYVFKDGGIEYRNPVYPGHGEASLMIAQNEIGIGFFPEETMAIRFHMGLWGADEREKKDFNAALARCPREIIITHTADWWAARVQEEGVFEK